MLRTSLHILADIPTVYAKARACLDLGEDGFRVVDCALADEAELVEAENHVRLKRGLFALGMSSGSWKYLLSIHQKARLKKYTQKWWNGKGCPADRDTCCVFNLTQNPDFTLSWTTAQGRMPTFTTGCSRMWVPVLRRWLLPRELAAAMGFPTYGVLAAAVGVPVETQVLSAHAIGNSMHVGNVGTVIAVTLACARWKKKSCAMTVCV